MAEKLTDFVWGDSGRNQHPWDQWLDGDVWKLEYGVDVGKSISSFGTQVRSAANRCGGKVRTKNLKNDEGNIQFIVIQFFVPEPESNNGSQQ